MEQNGGSGGHRAPLAMVSSDLTSVISAAILMAIFTVVGRRSTSTRAEFSAPNFEMGRGFVLLKDEFSRSASSRYDESEKSVVALSDGFNLFLGFLESLL